MKNLADYFFLRNFLYQSNEILIIKKRYNNDKNPVNTKKRNKTRTIKIITNNIFVITVVHSLLNGYTNLCGIINVKK